MRGGELEISVVGREKPQSRKSKGLCLLICWGGSLLLGAQPVIVEQSLEAGLGGVGNCSSGWDWGKVGLLWEEQLLRMVFRVRSEREASEVPEMKAEEPLEACSSCLATHRSIQTRARSAARYPALDGGSSSLCHTQSRAEQSTLHSF